MERRSISHRSLFTGFVLSLVLGCVVALYVHRRYVQYQPVALTHVPASALTVYRLNAEQAVVRKPLVQSVLPLFERGRSGPEPRSKHLERKTTIELDVDVRELVFATLPDERWLLVASGLLRQDDVVEGVQRMLEDEKIRFERQGDVLVHSSGIAFGVAEDGSLLLASDAKAVMEGADLGQEPPGAEPLRALGVALGVLGSPGPSGPVDGRSHVSEGMILVEADSHFPVTAQFRAGGGEWTRAQAEALFQSKKADFSFLIPFPQLQFLRAGDGEIRARGNLSREDFDASVTRLAELIGGRLENSLSSGK